MTFRNLKNPPIVEAIVSLIPVLDEPISIEKLNSVKEELAENYPIIIEKRLNSFVFKHNKDGSEVSQTDGTHGFDLKSKDEKTVIQLERDKITINRLPPYKSGNELIAICNTIFSTYTQLLNIKKIEHFGLRYINNMYVWSKEINSKIHAQSSLKSDKIDLACNNIITRYNVYSSAHNAGGVVHYVIEIPKDAPDDSEKGVQVKVIFDIDVYKRDIDVTTNYESNLNNLRDFKNHIFFENVDESLLKEYD